MADMGLHVRDDLPSVGFVPASVELFGDRPKLDDEVARKVLWFSLTAFFSPKAQ
jgi:hypothetical protein